MLEVSFCRHYNYTEKVLIFSPYSILPGKHAHIKVNFWVIFYYFMGSPVIFLDFNFPYITLTGKVSC